MKKLISLTLTLVILLNLIPSAIADTDNNIMTPDIPSLNTTLGLGAFHNGLAWFRTSSVNGMDKYGFMNHAGEVVIKPQYSYVSDFNEGLAMVKTSLSHWQFIDNTGEVVLDLNTPYLQVENFKDDRALVLKSFPDGNIKYGYIDKSGKEVISAQFQFARSFSNGFAFVVKNNKMCFIDVNGIRISSEYENYDSYFRDTDTNFFKPGDFIDGVAKMEVMGLDAVSIFEINKQGEEMDIPDILRNYQEFYYDPSGNGLAWVYKDNLIGLVNTKTEKVIFEPKYNFNDSYYGGYTFHEGLAAVKADTGWTYIDVNGNWMFDPIFDRIGPFSEGVAYVEVKGKDGVYGYINSPLKRQAEH
ncbi:WG repeat-containing protein [Paenibacillus cremeus]|uniref:WG repeat-containing protein n=1 Tax=Paenibacillus cremeus TaxID=2163881 RepID=A0A559K4Q9_9BACL|nr:WG repeat-containing protein [Paenibacillus cremeus]TVY07128.1 WG repeat-containing protein [Paenibacillus cremeus]